MTCRFVICSHGEKIDTNWANELCVYAGVDDKKVQTDIEGEDGRKRELHLSSVFCFASTSPSCQNVHRVKIGKV